MNKKLAWIAAAGLMAAGFAVYAFRPDAEDPNRKTQAGGAPPRPAGSATGSSTTGDAIAADSKGAPRKPGAWAELSEKYGGSRTNLSKKVTTDIADVLDESLELADMGAQMGGSKSAAEAAGKRMVSAMAGRLGLSEEQQAKATELVQGAVVKRLAAVGELTSAMRDDPGAMMEMLLAGDAVAREEMTEVEYDEVTGETRAMLQDVSGFVLGRRPDQYGNPLLGDAAFNSELSAILSPEQQQQLATYAEEMTASQETRTGRLNMPFQGGEIPVMELERLEETITSARQMAGGLRQLMEGMQGFQQNMPTQPDSP